MHIAAGGTLADVSSTAPSGHGHAIEARLSAEDPEHGFAPAPGLIEHLALPTGPGIRVDTGVATGDVISPEFDSLIAKVIAWGRDRREARARLVRALRQTAVVIHRGTTNKAFLLDLLDRPEFVAGEVDTTWLDAMMADGYAPPRRLDLALLATAVEAYDAHAQRQEGRLFASAERGRPEVGHETWHQVDVRADGAGLPAAGVPVPPGPATGWSWTATRWTSTSSATGGSSVGSPSATRPSPCSRSRRAWITDRSRRRDAPDVRR